MNLMIDYSYKGNRTVIQIEEEIDVELEKQLIELQGKYEILIKGLQKKKETIDQQIKNLIES